MFLHAKRWQSLYILYILEGGAADSFNTLFFLRAREDDTQREFVSARSIVRQFGYRDVVAVTDFEIVLLETDLEDEGVGVLDAVAEPQTHEERHPVEIEAIVEIVEPCLILIDEIGGEDRSSEAQRRGAASLFGDIEQRADVGGKFDRQRSDAIEAIVRLREVRSGKTGIPRRAVGHNASVEIQIPDVGMFGHLSRSHARETRDTVDHVGEAEVVPIQAGVDDAHFQTRVDPDFASQLEAEGIHNRQRSSRERSVVALAVSHHDGTHATMEGIKILVIRSGHRSEGAYERRPLASVTQRQTGTNLGASKCWVHVERVGIELRKNHILSSYALVCTCQQNGEHGNFG